MSGFLKSLFGQKDPPPAGGAISNDGAPSGDAMVGSAASVSNAGPIHVTDDTFGEIVLGSPMPVLVDFWAPWCGPCRMIAPVVEDLARDYEGQALIAKVNTDENVGIAGQLDIMGIPTLILFKDGQEVDRVVGYAPGHVLEEKLKAVLN